LWPLRSRRGAGFLLPGDWGCPPNSLKSPLLPKKEGDGASPVKQGGRLSDI
jgi:hypothetical protein